MSAEPSPRPPLPLIALGEAWVLTGFAVPLVFALARPELLANSTLGLTFALMALGAVLMNVKFRISPIPGSPIYSPVGAPIMFAVVACTPVQAMLVALVSMFCNWNAVRDALRGVERRMAFEPPGIAAMTALLLSLAAHAVGLSLHEPLHVLLAGFGAALGYVVLDGATYAIWMQVEAKAGGDVLAYVRSVAPLDVAVTGTSVVLALPFHGQPLLVLGVFAVWQVCVITYYRMSTSEHVHREQAGYLRETFSRYVPERVVERLAGREDQVRLGGETRTLSVLFCDIRGFTSWSEQHDAETVISQLNVVLSEMTEAVMRHDGTLDKFTGDGLMAFWGAPLAQPDHAVLACRAAADIHAALARCNALRAEQGMPPFSIGVGIASGPAVVGNIGHERRLDYTVIGDTVNLSARLEASTKELGWPTVISAPTAELLVDEFDMAPEPLGAVSVKGKAEPVPVFGLPADVVEDDDVAAA